MTCDGNNCEKNPQFTSSKSSTYDNSDQKSVQLTYGGGYLKGNIIKDTVHLSNIEVLEQEIAEVTEQDERSTTNFSCLIGLGFPELAPHGELLLFDNMMNRQVLDSNVFTTYYYKDDIHSDLHFGGINKQYYTGEIHYVDVQKRYHWNIKIDDIKINGNALNLCAKTNGCQGLVDTGTNLNTFESEEYAAVMEHFADSRGGYDCGKLSGLPTITYVIGGTDYSFSAAEYMAKEYNVCQLGFFKMDVFRDPEEQPAMVIGVNFMKKYFTVFDRSDDSRPRVGFALASDLKVDSSRNSEVDKIEVNDR